MSSDGPTSIVGQIKALYFRASKKQRQQIRAWMREADKHNINISKNRP